MVRSRPPARRFADPDADTHVARVVQMRVQRLEPIVPGSPSADFDLDASYREVQLVVDDDQSLQILDAITLHERLSGATRIVHVCHRERDDDSATVETDFRRECMGTPHRTESLSGAGSDHLDGVRTHVVPGLLELRAGIAEPEYEQAG